MSFPNLWFWSHLIETIGIEVCALAALGFVAQCGFRRAVWKRAVWQATVICLLVVVASEWTGFGRGMAWSLVGPKRTVQSLTASAILKWNAEFAHRPTALWLSTPLAAVQPAMWWPGCVWLAGAAIVLGRIAAAQVLLLALRVRREKIAGGSLPERVLHVAKSVGMRRRVCLLRMPETISPMAFGVLRPSVGLPPGFETRFSAAEQDAVLSHELAHLAAADPAWFLLADFASALLWWHPLAWWVRRSLHVSSELAADEATIVVPNGPGSLAKCLVALGKEMTAGRGWGWVGINGGFRSNLGKRVERLMRMPASANGPLSTWAGAVARIAVTIIVVPMVVLLIGAFQTAEGQSENGWRQSWNSSPGALLLLAAQDDTDMHKESIADRVQRAKLLYELGKLDESEAILIQILKDSPSNRTAPYFLDLIKEARWKHKHESPITPIPLATNKLVYAKGREQIFSKLNGIILNEVHYDLPLTEVLNRLRIESQKRDPEGVGIQFLINPNADPAVRDLAPTDTTGNVPAGAVGVAAPTPAVDMSTVTIKIPHPLTNLRLIDVLNAITMVADQPIKFTVEDYGVVFSPKSTEAATLYSKVFHVDPNTFLQGLQQVSAVALKLGTQTNRAVAEDVMVRAFFTAAGVNLTDPGKSVFFNDRRGLLLVRATADELRIIEQAVPSLNQQPAQVVITAKFVELSQQESAVLGFNWFLQRSSNSSNIMTGILSDRQYRMAINAIEHKTGKDILSMPTVTTLSGRQVHFASQNSQEIVIGNSTNSLPLAAC